LLYVHLLVVTVEQALIVYTFKKGLMNPSRPVFLRPVVLRQFSSIEFNQDSVCGAKSAGQYGIEAAYRQILASAEQMPVLNFVDRIIPE